MLRRKKLTAEQRYQRWLQGIVDEFMKAYLEKERERYSDKTSRQSPECQA